MFQRHTDDPGTVTAHGFTVSVDVEDGAQPIEHIVGKLAEALTWVEGVGNVEVNYIGEMDVVPESKA